jgi:hypothetical protein
MHVPAQVTSRYQGYCSKIFNNTLVWKATMTYLRNWLHISNEDGGMMSLRFYTLTYVRTNQHVTESFLWMRWFNSQSINFPHSTAPEGSLRCPQGHTSCPHPKQSRHWPPSHFLKTHFNITLPFIPQSSHWSCSLRFPHQNTVCILLFSLCTTCPANFIFLEFIMIMN